MDWSKLRDRVLRQWPEMGRTVLQDFGALSLGAAAIFLTRAFPSPNSPEPEQFSATMVAASAAFATVGIALRMLSKFWR